MAVNAYAVVGVDLDRQEYPILLTGDATGEGVISSEELKNGLPEGEELRNGYYDVSEQGKSLYVGQSIPGGLDD